MAKEKRRAYSSVEFAVDGRYTLKTLLYKGTFCTTCLAESEDGKFAIKKVFGKHLKEPKILRRILRELEILAHLNGHPDINTLCDVDMVSKPPHDGFYCYLTLFDTDLKRVLASQAPITNDHVKSIMYQLFRGLHYMHSANVVHRDLKPANIHVNCHGKIKICDFSVASGSSMQSDLYCTRVKVTSYVANEWYRAPETYLCEDNGSGYTYALDMWSAGCILCELILRRPLFKGDNRLEILANTISIIDRPPIYLLSDQGKQYVEAVLERYVPPRTSLYSLVNGHKQVTVLASKLLNYNPASRPDARTCLQDDLVKGYYNGREPSCSQFTFTSDNVPDHALKDILLSETANFRRKIRSNQKSVATEILRTRVVEPNENSLRALDGV